MRRITVGTVLGVPLRIDLTLFVALAVIAFEVGNRIERLAAVLHRTLGLGVDRAALAGGLRPWLLGIAAGVGLFVGVALHELGHSLVARRFGYRIDSITLWAFGGVASPVDLPDRWTHEAAIAVAGPAVSLALGGLSYGGLSLLPASFVAGRFVLGYLALLNVSLAAFNLLPGFPMDGGRVLRALLARSRPFADATRIATAVGQAIAVLIGLFGLLTLDVIAIGVAFFLFIGAAAEARQVELRTAFEGIPVRELMTPFDDLRTVRPGASVADLVARMLSERHVGYPVVRDGRLVGIVTMDDIEDVPPDERPTRPVADVMTTEVVTVPHDADASAAFDAMLTNDIGRVVVTDGRGRLVGLVSRSDLLRAFDLLGDAGPDRRRGDTGTGREIPIS